jgi:hypothetical protein
LKERSGFDVPNHFVLLGGGQGGKTCGASDFGLCPPIEIRNALCVERLLCSVEGPERAIDEVDGAGFCGSRPTVHSGKNPRRESGNDFHLRSGQSAALRGDGCRPLLAGESEGIFDFEKISGRPSRPGGYGGLQEGSTSMKIGHAWNYNPRDLCGLARICR